ncbi:hypothetical protein [uncultured Dubosiella sp.]|uniref:hypothetical protein n=1 Tax=uncultured Dubosiella sp. TaxID=1937011 RepID=UPI0025872AA4|nr:hypothetical protein [uncultured Dubosiella sp.]
MRISKEKQEETKRLYELENAIMRLKKEKDALKAGLVEYYTAKGVTVETLENGLVVELKEGKRQSVDTDKLKDAGLYDDYKKYSTFPVLKVK